MHCNFILTFEIYDIEIQDNAVKLIRKETDLLQQPNSFRKSFHTTFIKIEEEKKDSLLNSILMRLRDHVQTFQFLFHWL